MEPGEFAGERAQLVLGGFVGDRQPLGTQCRDLKRDALDFALGHCVEHTDRLATVVDHLRPESPTLLAELELGDAVAACFGLLRKVAARIKHDEVLVGNLCLRRHAALL